MRKLFVAAAVATALAVAGVATAVVSTLSVSDTATNQTSPPTTQPQPAATQPFDEPTPRRAAGTILDDPYMAELNTQLTEPHTPRQLEDVTLTERTRPIVSDLGACLPPDTGTASPETLHETDLCLTETGVAWVETAADPLDAIRAFRLLYADRPDIADVCHTASHEVSQAVVKAADEALNSRTATISDLARTGGSICLAGFVHGVTDLMGRAEPAYTLGDYEEIADACIDAGAGGACAHGIGHALWQTFGTIDAAARGCGFWTERAYRNLCAEGVVMEKYDQVRIPEEERAGFDLGAWFTDQRQLCDEWPRDALPAGAEEPPLEGCVWAMTQVAFIPAFDIAQDSGWNVAETIDELETHVTEIDRLCGDFGDLADICRFQFGLQIPNAVGFDRDASFRLCAVMTDDDFSELCRFRAGLYLDSLSGP